MQINGSELMSGKAGQSSIYICVCVCVCVSMIQPVKRLYRLQCRGGNYVANFYSNQAIFPSIMRQNLSLSLSLSSSSSKLSHTDRETNFSSDHCMIFHAKPTKLKHHFKSNSIYFVLLKNDMHDPTECSEQSLQRTAL